MSDEQGWPANAWPRDAATIACGGQERVGADDEERLFDEAVGQRGGAFLAWVEERDLDEGQQMRLAAWHIACVCRDLREKGGWGEGILDWPGETVYVAGSLGIVGWSTFLSVGDYLTAFTSLIDGEMREVMAGGVPWGTGRGQWAGRTAPPGAGAER